MGARARQKPRLSVHLRRICEIDAASVVVGRCLVRPEPNDVFQASRQPFDPGSSTAGCASHASSSYVEGLWSPASYVCREKAG